jgi:hypothetical protein
MRDLLWVHKESICEIGEQVVLVFQIRNRAKGAKFHLGDVQVLDDGRRLDTRLLLQDAEGEAVRPDSVRLDFDDEVVGAVSWPRRAVKTLVLRITEAKGKERVVELPDVGF